MSVTASEQFPLFVLGKVGHGRIPTGAGEFSPFSPSGHGQRTSSTDRARHGEHGIPVGMSNYAVFKGPATLYVLRMMPDGKLLVLTRASSRGPTLSEKKRLPRPSKTG